jgi:uncharacterized protein YegP (UPF0339 family)
MGEVRFRTRPAASGGDEYDFAVSDDGQAFTLRFSELQAVVDAGAGPDLVAARVFCVVVPVDGGDDGVDISFRTDGVMSALEGGSGFAVLDVNGATTVSHFPSGTDEGFGQELRFRAAGPTGQCHLTVVVVAQRDPAFPDAGATIGVSSVDGEVHRHRAGRFVLKRGQAGGYHFNLVAGNGEVIATSEAYQSKGSALNGIESVQRHAAGAGVDDQTSG